MVFGVAAQQLRSPRGRGAPSAHQLAQLGLICLAWAIVGALWLVFDFDAGRPASMIVLGLAVVFYAMRWWGAPLGASRGSRVGKGEAS